jgi:hypothetical protein
LGNFSCDKNTQKPNRRPDPWLHFYSPRRIPKEGKSTGGADISGGLEQIGGFKKEEFIDPVMQNPSPR